MKDFFYYLFLFLLGGQSYCTVEIITRGRTHYSMFFAAGLIFLYIRVTEFIFGCIFNLKYSLAVWDYSNQPFNVLGQICLPFSILWFFACFVIFKWIIKDDFYRRLF